MSDLQGEPVRSLDFLPPRVSTGEALTSARVSDPGLASAAGDDGDAATVTHEGSEDPAHHADEQRPPDRRPEAVDHEALHELGGEPETEPVEHEEEEAQRGQRHRQGEDDQDRAYDRVDQPEDQSRRSEEHTSELQSPTNLVCR